MDHRAALWLLPSLLTVGVRAEAAAVSPPAVRREFRAVWIASVANIDWPSRPGLPPASQRAEMTAILDRAAALHMNAVVLQVRPACDALYPSRLEPWSEYLTGQMGQAPEPFYDPLAFAVAAAHRRGLELHAWFNPYRARHPTARSPISDDHVSRHRPAIVRTYGTHLWLDPGERATQDYSLAVILDVVRRYDIDGVHLDDYFYPYKERDAAGALIDFPDQPSWDGYRARGGTLGRDDWRRRNVDDFVRRLYRGVKAAKAWVKVGISPFGIWRPGYPAQIRGFDAYEQLYADARRWLRQGWVDYLAPQLYWRIDQPAQSYPVLLQWWAEQNTQRRHLWPGNYTSRVADGSATAWPTREVLDQIAATRAQRGATGNVHFSMKAFLQDRGGINEALLTGPYADAALVPASPWLGARRPSAPRVTERQRAVESEMRVAWKSTGSGRPWLWVVQTRAGGKWGPARILPAAETTYELQLRGPAAPGDCLTISAVNRLGVQGPPAVVKLR